MKQEQKTTSGEISDDLFHYIKRRRNAFWQCRPVSAALMPGGMGTGPGELICFKQMRDCYLSRHALQHLMVPYRLKVILRLRGFLCQIRQDPQVFLPDIIFILWAYDFSFLVFIAHSRTVLKRTAVFFL